MIKYLIAERIREYLTENINSGVSEKEPYWVNEIQSFRYLSNPAVDGTRIIIYADNPDEIDFRDARIDATQTQMFDLGLKLPVGEIGGGHFWWRRGTVKVEFYGLGKLSQDTRYDAAEVAYNILGRTQHYLERVPVHNITDNFGEQGVYFYVINSTFKESGGNKVNIWRGALYWQALTQRSF